MASKKTVYLAHPVSAVGRYMTCCEDRMRWWLRESKKQLVKHDILWIDPQDMEWDDDTQASDIVRQNIEDIHRSDLVLAYCDLPSHGVGGEIVHTSMKYYVKKPIIVYSTSSLSAWITHHATEVVFRMDQQELKLLELLGMIRK